MSCAAGLAVLDVLQEESLVENARVVGAYLLAKLRELSERQDERRELALIGDVRGAGLFIGVEFVLDRKTKVPAGDLASRISNLLKDKHCILTSTDGPFHNVLVIKPPMCFSRENADTLVIALGDVLKSLGGDV